MRITSCPSKLVTDDVWRALMLADFAKRGNLPVPGGVLDQTEIINQAIRMIWNEQATHRTAILKK